MNNTPTFKITGKIWLWDGEAAWHFFSIPKKYSKDIKSITSHIRRGFGSVKVEAQIGKTKWRTSIFPTKEGEYLLPIKAQVRKVEKLKSNQNTTVIISIV